MKKVITQETVNRIYTLMREQNVSTNEMCKILNVKYPDFIGAIQGKHQFYGKWQTKISERLGVDKKELFHEFYDEIC